MRRETDEERERRQRDRVFQKMFRLPASERLEADFTCTLRGVGKAQSFPGRLYISAAHLCFMNTAGTAPQSEVHVVPLAEVTGVERRTTAIFLPDAIEVFTPRRAFFFENILNRDAAFALLQRLALATQARDARQPDLIPGVRREVDASPAAAFLQSPAPMQPPPQPQPQQQPQQQQQQPQQQQQQLQQPQPQPQPQLQPPPSPSVGPAKAEPPPRSASPQPAAAEVTLSPAPPTSFPADTELKLIADFVLPLPAHGVWRAFFADDAPFSLPRFFEEAKTGQTAHRQAPWRALDEETRERNWAYVMELRSTPFGPKSTRVHQYQRVKFTRDQSFFVESCTITPDTPYSDCFYTAERVSVRAEPGAPHRSRIVVSLRPVFVKSTLVSSIITSKSFAGALETYGLWARATAAWVASHEELCRSLGAAPPAARAAAARRLSLSERLALIAAQPLRHPAGAAAAVAAATASVPRVAALSLVVAALALLAAQPGWDAAGVARAGGVATLLLVAWALAAALASAEHRVARLEAELAATDARLREIARVVDEEAARLRGSEHGGGESEAGSESLE